VDFLKDCILALVVPKGLEHLNWRALIQPFGYCGESRIETQAASGSVIHEKHNTLVAICDNCIKDTAVEAQEPCNL
jgi:hypothetical protein